MKALLLTQVLPYPLDAGPKVRAYYVLRHLARAHAVVLVSFCRPTDTPAALKHLGQFCQELHTLPMPRSRVRDAWHLLRSLANGAPFLIARDWVPAMAALIGDQLDGADFDVIHADQLWMAPYALYAKSQISNLRASVPSVRGSKIPRLVLDQHNAVYKIPARMAETERNPLKRGLMALEARKLARYETAICQQFDRVVWVTQEDHRAVQRFASRSGARVPNSAVIPICGDPAATPVLLPRSDPRRVTFLGGLHYPPNAQAVRWFAEQVFPQVLAQVPDAVLTVIGKDPPPEITQLKPQIPDPNLEVTGYVSDPRPWLEGTAAFVVPLLAGGGMRVKILDAWMWGLPVIATTVGAEGIEYRDGEDLLIADSAEAFAQAVIRVLREPGLTRRLRDNGRRRVEEYYDWRGRYAAWDKVYKEACT
jgi:glycosyltransferase involved in cell wall biosynthesis